MKRVLRSLLVLCATAALGLLLVFAFSESAMAQCPTPLCLSNNYFVTGDYVVGSVGLEGTGVSGLATGTISIPDPMQPNAKSVPVGADIVAAFLYWETVQSSNAGALTGQNGFFNGYPISGMPLGNPNAPTSWSSGGCSGSSQGSKTMVAYRADVRPFLNLDANGKAQVDYIPYAVKLPDSGSNGNGVPLTLGATLVIVYRVQSPNEPLSSIVFYDGAYAPSNTSSTMTQPIVGFYDADASPVAEITHIVGNGQPNKSESVLLNGTILPSLYANLPPFPGIYNGSWDSPTWSFPSANIGNPISADDSSEMTSVVPSTSNSGCVNWGAVIFKTTVDDPDHDGVLMRWKQPLSGPPGYTDALTSKFVSLPGAMPGEKDLFVELDYLSNLDLSAGIYPHSHLPKQQALDMVGDAFARQGIHVHFDVGNVYQAPRPGGPSAMCGSPAVPCDPYIISNPPGTGGNAISEGSLQCKDGAALCQFPGQVSVGWKGSYLSVMSSTTLGNLNSEWPAQKDSYHYVLFGHALGSPRTYWSAAAAESSLVGEGIATLNSIGVNNNVGTVTLTTPPPLLKPGDCPNASIPACSDPSIGRVTIDGALQPQNVALNGTYYFSAPPPQCNSSTNLCTTTFTIQTTGVSNGTYNFSNEPQLGLAYGGPTSASGFSDIGGGDSSVMFGLWPADDTSGCQPDPSKSLGPNQLYCVNQVGTIQAEAGTLLHELGHTFFLTHGGTLYPNGLITSGPLAGQQQNTPFGAPTYALNCNPAFLSSMNYLYQIRGFPEVSPDGTHPIDYSGQTMLPLSEKALDEGAGIGLDFYTQGKAQHFARWYAPASALDIKLHDTATLHCDGTPIGPNEPPAVRVDGTTFSSPIDWDNDFTASDVIEPLPWQDVDFNGSTAASPDAPFPGFNDWVNLDLRQVGARASAYGSSSGSGSSIGAGGGSSIGAGGGSSIGAGGGSSLGAGGGSLIGAGGGSSIGAGGGSLIGAGGGTEQDADTANSTVDPPGGLAATLGKNSVVLTWTPPDFGQIREYDIWRAQGTFTFADLLANPASFKMVGKVIGAPPATTFTDTTVKNNTTYTYFVTDKNAQGARSGPSSLFVIPVSFGSH